MLSGILLIVGLAGVQSGHTAIVEGLKSVLPREAGPGESPPNTAGEAGGRTEQLSPRMQGALDYVARRYRVSNDVLQPIFSAVQSTGRELNLDPLLIVAVIGVESGFNPFSQSVLGAQGLMQVVPRYHRDKLPSDAGELPFFDPLTNVQIGARVLQESIRRYGGIEDGLQQFGGASNDPERRYSNRVLAERQRLELAVQPPRPARVRSGAPAVQAEEQESAGQRQEAEVAGDGIGRHALVGPDFRLQHALREGGQGGT